MDRLSREYNEIPPTLVGGGSLSTGAARLFDFQLLHQRPKSAGSEPIEFATRRRMMDKGKAQLRGSGI